MAHDAVLVDRGASSTSSPAATGAEEDLGGGEEEEEEEVGRAVAHPGAVLYQLQLLLTQSHVEHVC